MVAFKSIPLGDFGEKALALWQSTDIRACPVPRSFTGTHWIPWIVYQLFSWPRKLHTPYHLLAALCDLGFSVDNIMGLFWPVEVWGSLRACVIQEGNHIDVYWELAIRQVCVGALSVFSLILKITFFCFFFRATPVAYGSPQARGRIGAVAAGLQPQRCGIWATSATYTTAHGSIRSLTQWVGPGIEPASWWILVGFVSTVPQWEFLKIIFKWFL